MQKHSIAAFVCGPALLVALVACGGGDAQPSGGQSAAAPPAPASVPDAGPATPTGTIIEVRMVTTMGGGSGEYQPGTITARRGDVIRFVNDGSAAHNISMPAALNPGRGNLPPPSPYLVSAGEEYDLAVNLAPGTYEFQCDPHMAMGMKGTLVVID
jgi:plastocyanin